VPNNNTPTPKIDWIAEVAITVNKISVGIKNLFIVVMKILEIQSSEFEASGK
jgi:hypothetical protein